MGMRKTDKKPTKVKCADCGFLSLVDNDDFSYVSADILYRLEGCQSGQGATAHPTVSREPHCSTHYQSIHTEPFFVKGVGAIQFDEAGSGLGALLDGQGKDVTGEAVLRIITKRRVCDGFYPWKPGFTPKEHYEMLDRERWQKWQQDQRRSDRHWRIVELIVLGLVAILIAGGFTVLGAFIGRGSLFPPHP
jgi:hypothetical protein